MLKLSFILLVVVGIALAIPEDDCVRRLDDAQPAKSQKPFRWAQFAKHWRASVELLSFNRTVNLSLVPAHLQSRVVGVMRAAKGRVSGVEVRRADGRLERIAARMVVGADGRSSTIAKLVGAEEYLGYEGPRATYWAYWRRPRARGIPGSFSTSPTVCICGCSSRATTISC